MAEDRMLNDEILLGLIKSNSGGGGGGTDDYNDLENLPQIGGVTLQGNKTASDLGLASEEDLEEKQDVLTAGNYISIANDGTISVTQSIGVYDLYSYKIEGRNGGGNYWTNVIKSVNGVQVSSNTYSNTQAVTAINVDDLFTLRYGLGTDSKWHVTLLVDSNEHQAGEDITWRYSETKDFTETFNISQDSSTDLATKGDVTAALATKVDKVEGKGLSTNDYSDTEKAQVATNASDISSLKSGLTNVDNVTTLNTQDLTTPSRTKNLLPMTLNGIKSANTAGTWSGNAYTVNGITFTVQTDADNNVTGIKLDGSVSAQTVLNLCSNKDFLSIGDYILTDGSQHPSTSVNVTLFKNNNWFGSTTNGGVLNVSSQGTDTFYAQIYVNTNAGTLSSYMFYPMIRPATITDPTFAPYIPSVESRLEALEAAIAQLTNS